MSRRLAAGMCCALLATSACDQSDLAAVTLTEGRTDDMHEPSFDAVVRFAEGTACAAVRGAEVTINGRKAKVALYDNAECEDGPWATYRVSMEGALPSTEVDVRVRSAKGAAALRVQDAVCALHERRLSHRLEEEGRAPFRAGSEVQLELRGEKAQAIGRLHWRTDFETLEETEFPIARDFAELTTRVPEARWGWLILTGTSRPKIAHCAGATCEVESFECQLELSFGELVD